MEIKQLLKQIERENERTKDQRKKNKSLSIGLEHLKTLTVGEIKKLNEEICKGLKDEKTINNQLNNRRLKNESN